MWAELRILCSSVESKRKKVLNNPHFSVGVRSHLRSESHLTIWGLLVGYWAGDVSWWCRCRNFWRVPLSSEVRFSELRHFHWNGKVSPAQLYENKMATSWVSSKKNATRIFLYISCINNIFFCGLKRVTRCSLLLSDVCPLFTFICPSFTRALSHTQKYSVLLLR